MCRLCRARDGAAACPPCPEGVCGLRAAGAVSPRWDRDKVIYKLVGVQDSQGGEVALAVSRGYTLCRMRRSEHPARATPKLGMCQRSKVPASSQQKAYSIQAARGDSPERQGRVPHHSTHRIILQGMLLRHIFQPRSVTVLSSLPWFEKLGNLQYSRECLLLQASFSCLFWRQGIHNPSDKTALISKFSYCVPQN